MNTNKPTPERARQPAPDKKAPVKAEPEPVATAPVEEPVRMSELPAEKRPLILPPDFDPSNYPHYSVQSSIYSLLLTALNMSEHYERYPNVDIRRNVLENAVIVYQDTCDALKVKA